ncbi:Alpha/Beta hydrolase protein [Xylogone sp. PMI_703]|nr:Alpha/Beta hydrolase protein [Xylogone sp. PMI_703]
MALHESPTTVEGILKLGEPDAELVEMMKVQAPYDALVGTIEEMRSGIAAQAELYKDRVQALLANINVASKTCKARDGYNIPLLVYSPKVPKEGGSPLAILIHGGAFVLGTPEHEVRNAALLTTMFGFVSVSVGYRIAPEHVFPTAPNDCWDATLWVAENASTLGADPSTGFIVSGTSAGGNLAAVVALEALHKDLSPPLTGAYLAIPSTLHFLSVPEEHKTFYLSLDQNASAPLLNRPGIDKILEYYKPDPHSPLFAPFHHVKGHKGLPPTYFQICGMDPLRDDGILYEQLLRKERVKTKIDIYPGMPHGFWGVYPNHRLSSVFNADTFQGITWLQQEGQAFLHNKN